MKTITAHGKYTVSFNTEMGDYEVGESSRDTTDFAGDNIKELAAEVIADNADFPMVFERVEDDWVVGVFRDVEEDYVVAVMFKGSF